MDSRPAFWQVGALYLSAIVMMIAASAFLPLLVPVDSVGGMHAVTVISEILLSVPLVAAFALAFRYPVRQVFRLRAPTLRQCAHVSVMAVSGYVLIVIGASLWMLLLQALGLDTAAFDRLDEMFKQSPLWANLLVVALTPAIFEELLFRGVVLSGLERFGRRKALLISALLFAALHGTIVQLPTTFVLGLLIGIVVLGTGSLFAGVLYHFLHNGLAIVQMHIIEPHAELLSNLTPDNPQAMLIGGIVTLFVVASMAIFPISLISFLRRYPGPDIKPQPSPRIAGWEWLPLSVGIALVLVLMLASLLPMVLPDFFKGFL